MNNNYIKHIHNYYANFPIVGLIKVFFYSKMQTFFFFFFLLLVLQQIVKTSFVYLHEDILMSLCCLFFVYFNYTYLPAFFY